MVVNPPAAETLFEHFEIEFDAGAEPIFHGGELVTGSLKIQLKNEATINSIRLQFRGRAVFINPAGNKKSTESQTEKVYFDKDFVLLERPPGHPEPGHFPWNANFLYSLPFECPLPKGCETSYEGPHGFIRYYARVILETEEPYKAQYLVKKAFSIISSPELHQLVAPYSEPIAEKKSMRFGGCCCRSRMNAEIYLPKSAYAPGENIVGTFRMDPRTAKNAIEHIEVRLVDRLHRILDQPEASATITENDHNATSDETTPMIETDGAKKGKKEKQPKKKGRNESKQQQKEQPLCQRVVTGRKLTKEDMGRGGTGPQMEQTNSTKGGPQMVTQTNVFFIRIPAVAPSTQIEKERKPHQSMLFDELVDGENAENGQFHRLLESPSTATLRARKEPFLRVDYALQISFGNHVLMELPIQVHPIPIYAKGIQFRPFAGGAQPIGEPDESSQIPFNAPFTFTPQYPMYLESPKPIEVDGDGHIIDEAQQITILAPANGGAEMVAVSNGVAAQGGGGSGPAKVVLTKSTAEMQIPTVPLVVIKEGPVEEGQQQGQNSAQPQQQGVAEHELNKSPNEMDGRQMGEETTENGRPSTTTTVQQPNGEGAEGGTRTTTTTDIAAEPPSSTGPPPPPVEHKHDEQFEQLANGHTLHTSTDEWIQKNGNGGGENDEDGKEVRRVVQEEHYEIQNEDGSRVSVQKTVEKISSMETRIVENGEANGEKGQNGKEGGGGGEDGTNTTNSNDQQQQQQLQMDISMSG